MGGAGSWAAPVAAPARLLQRTTGPPHYALLPRMPQTPGAQPQNLQWCRERRMDSGLAVYSGQRFEGFTRTYSGYEQRGLFLGSSAAWEARRWLCAPHVGSKGCTLPQSRPQYILVVGC